MKSSSTDNSAVSSRAVDALTRYAGSLSRHVTPIFLAQSAGDAQLKGTGTLVRSENNLYLVTAAHVIDPVHRAGNLFLLGSHKQVIYLSGRPTTCSPLELGEERKDDPVDVAVIQLPNEPQARELRARAVPMAHLKAQCLPRKDKSYLATGCPGSKTNVDWKNKFITVEVATQMYGSLPDEKYQELARPAQFHILLDYRNNELYSADGKRLPKHRAAELNDLKGMSGAPIWMMYDHVSFNDERVTPLVGILTGIKPHHRAILATDILVAMSFIMKFEGA